MTTLASTLNSSTPKQLGENAHVEYGWSNDLREKIVQLFFQLVRTNDRGLKNLSKKLNDILYRLKGHENTKEFSLMYRLIGQTRDIVSGKGEKDLTYMQLGIWWEHGYETLVKNALKLIVKHPECQHQYGSWGDIKYFCEYLKTTLQYDTNHSLIRYACELMVEQIMCDWETYMDHKESLDDGELKISLAAKWAPREKSAHKWLNKKMCSIWGEMCAWEEMDQRNNDTKSRFPHAIKLETWKWFDSAKTHEQKLKAKLKLQIYWNKMITEMNKKLQTTQINFCNSDWSNIDFNTVTSKTLSANNLAIRNKEKRGTMLINRKHKTEHSRTDRIQCAINYQNHINAAKAGDTTKKIHGKRCGMYEMVKSAIKGFDDETTNEQWKSNSTNNDALHDMIACVDTSGSMSIDDKIPLYNAIGLGIRIAEKCNSAFKNRVLTFDSTPQWIQLNEESTFCEKVRHLENASWGLNTNFHKMIKMILDVAIENKLLPEQVNKMILCVLSDMQIDDRMAGDEHSNMNTMYDEVREMYHNAGLQAVGAPYTPPHIVFFNLRKTNGFPVLSTEKNVTMLSGYSPAVLNVFCDKGLKSLQEITPINMLKNILNSPRYNPMQDCLKSYLLL